MKAEERLRYYASIFPTVEADASYYYPPTEEVAGLWVNRTPAGFTMHIKAYSLFTNHPTRPDSLWPEVADEVPMEHREKRSVYLSHLPDPAVDQAWELFRQALMPLHSAGKLGVVLFQFPPWFRPNSENRAYLKTLQGRLPDYDLAVEFRHGSWLSDDERGRSLGLLEHEGLSYVCVDEPQGFDSSVPPVVAATADIAVVRFHGRNAETWEEKWISAAERFAYRYTDENVRRLRANLGLPDALVHPVGGTDNKSTDADYRNFVRACVDTHSLGGSIYDWRTTPTASFAVLRGVPE